jgi:hypothetical protein
MSKELIGTGMRIGFAAGPEYLIKAITNVQGNSSAYIFFYIFTLSISLTFSTFLSPYSKRLHSFPSTRQRHGHPKGNLPTIKRKKRFSREGI